MIKEEIISFVLNLLPKEDKTLKYHPRFVEAAIEEVLKDMYKDLYRIDPNQLDRFTKQYGITTAVAVSLESATSIYYSTIPATIINLPCKSSGVRAIYTVTHEGNVFIPMDAREGDFIFNTDVATVTDKIGYRVREDTRVDYYNASAAVISEGVRMDLLVPFSVYADTDVVHIPELGEKEGGTFTRRILEVLGVIQPIDLQDDNKEATQTNKRQ